MILDFTNLNKKQQIKLDKIFHNCKTKVENLIYKILKQEKKEIVFFNLIARNPEENNLYYKLSVVKLVQFYFRKYKINKVIIKDFYLKKILERIFKDVKFISIEKKKYIHLKNLSNFFKNFYYLIKLFLFKDKKRKIKIFERKKIILLDIFMIKSMFNNKLFKDRYYGELLKKNNSEIFLLPIFFNNSLNKKNLSCLDDRVNYILHSDFLNLKDFLLIFFSFLKVNFLRDKKIFFEGLDISQLIRNEISEKRYSHALLNSIINFYFFKKLKNTQINLYAGIDWFENQIVDKSFNYCITKFFPNAKLKGYLGINADLSVNSFLVPTIKEKKLGLCPKEIYLINNLNKKFFNKAYKTTNIKIAPAYRNQKIFNYLKFSKKKSKKFKLLVIFTASHLDSINLINNINDLSKNLKQKITFILRFHNFSKTIELIKKIDASINFSVENYKSIYDLIIKADCILCRPGTTYYEAKIFQTPLILTRRIYGILPVNKKKLISDGFCFDQTDIEKRLEYLIKRKTNQKTQKKLASIYFTPNTDNKTQKFLK